jgi:hypothetical protein
MNATVTRWVCIVVRSNGQDIDPISELFIDEAEARKYARRCLQWFQCVHSVRIMPVQLDGVSGFDVPTGLDPADLFNQAEG